MPSTNTKIIGSAWGFSSLWNAALDSIPERPLVKRNYIYASELSGSFIDRYLKMNAVKMSNPPNDRSRRKFSAGHVFEWIVGMVLTMTGILKSKQLRGEVELPGMLRVSGRHDFIAGGVIDFVKAKQEIKKIQEIYSLSIGDMPPIIFHAIEYILSAMEKEFGSKMLKEVVFECKSVSSFMSARIEKTNQPMPHHVLQCFHYILANKLDESYLVYICKDDMISHQFSITNNKNTLKSYKEDIQKMTDYYNVGFNAKKPLQLAPPKEPEIFFDDGLYKFSSNFKVEYSPYLQLIYQIENPEAYRLKWAKTISSYSRTFKRCVRGDNMTQLNKDVIKEVSKIFPEWDKYVLLARKNGAFQKSEENEDE